MAHGLSTRYVRTGAMNPRNQVSAQSLFEAFHGTWLPAAELLAVAHEAGLTDAYIENDRVLLPGAAYKGQPGVLEGTKSVEREAARRARRAA